MSELSGIFQNSAEVEGWLRAARWARAAMGAATAVCLITLAVVGIGMPSDATAADAQAAATVSAGYLPAQFSDVQYVVAEPIETF